MLLPVLPFLSIPPPHLFFLFNPSVAPKEERTSGNTTVTQRRVVQIGTGETGGTPDAARTASQRMDTSYDDPSYARGAPRARTD